MLRWLKFLGEQRVFGVLDDEYSAPNSSDEEEDYASWGDISNHTNTYSNHEYAETPAGTTPSGYGSDSSSSGGYGSSSDPHGTHGGSDDDNSGDNNWLCCKKFGRQNKVVYN